MSQPWRRDPIRAWCWSEREAASNLNTERGSSVNWGGFLETTLFVPFTDKNQFDWDAIQPAKVYNLVVFIEPQNCAAGTTVNLKTFSSPPKKHHSHCQFALHSPLPPASSNHQFMFCVCEIAYSEHFIQMECGFSDWLLSLSIVFKIHPCGSTILLGPHSFLWLNSIPWLSITYQVNSFTSWCKLL